MTSAVAVKTDTPNRCTEAPKLRIALVENHAIMREGLKRLIEIHADFSVVADFGCVEECLNGIGDILPDVLVTDLIFPRLTGIELLHQIQRLSPATRTLVLTEHDSENHVRGALQAGANGYVLKECRSDELMLALRTVAAGQQFLCKTVAGKVLSTYLSRDTQPAYASVARSLTGRERSVLTNIALGNSNKLIARQLGVSPKTIEKHRSNLMRKLQLRNVAAITMYAIRHGMTSPDPLGGLAGARHATVG
jgi:DNA-binding NarL/FixJ family response regulator